MNPSRKISQMLKKMIPNRKVQQASKKNIHPISASVKNNEQTVKTKLGNSDDIMYTKFNLTVKEHQKIDALLVAVDGLVDEDVKRDNILKPLQQTVLNEKPNTNLDQLQNEMQVKKIEVTNDLHEALDQVLQAKILILVNGHNKGLLIQAEGFENRAIEEPANEKAVRAAHEGFIENNSVNVTLIRRRVVDQNLRFESFEIGKITKTDVKLGYIKGIADPGIVKKTRDKLEEIELDAIHNEGEIEQLIEDHPYSIFPTVGNTERPDRTAALLTEGRVIILTNGSPIVLFGPNLFLESFTTHEDYVSRPYYSSLLRLTRFIAFFICIYAPGLYLTALNFEKNLIPSDLIVPIIQARELVPFPLVMELLIAILLYEIVREAGVRLPESVGSALSIVGALILGEVAVSAGLIGAPTIVVVSLSYIASFIITPIADVVSLLRVILIIAASLFGTFGIIMVSLGILTHMVSLTSFGVSYMAPFSPFYFRDWKDTFIRLPARLLRRRPESIPNQKPKSMESIPDTEDN
ncbi:spore germination protein [Virgibacillus kimchii]